MDIDRILLWVTCVSSTLTFFCVTVAILPRMKEGMVVIRDATLWLAFLLVLGGLGWGGWQNLQKGVVRAPGDWLVSPPAAETSAVAATAPPPAAAASGDPYYRGAAR